jgi:hypothetical protein
MPLIPAPTTYVDGNVLSASTLNSDFGTFRTYANTYLLFKDVAGTVSVGHTFTATQTFTPGAGFALDVTTGGVRIQAGGITATGNLLLTGEARSLDATVDTRVRSVNASSAGQVGTFSSHDLWLVSGGTQRIAINTSGHVVPLAANTYHLGLTGSRFQDGWFNGNMTIGGNLSFSGTLTGGTFGATTFGGAVTVTTGGVAVTGTSSIAGVFTASDTCILGATGMANTATTGYVQIPTTPGNPSGIPTNVGTRASCNIDAGSSPPRFCAYIAGSRYYIEFTPA